MISPCNLSIINNRGSVSMGVYEYVKQALQDVVAPELKALQVETKRLDNKIDTRFTSLNEKIDSRIF